MVRSRVNRLIRPPGFSRGSVIFNLPNDALLVFTAHGRQAMGGQSFHTLYRPKLKLHRLKPVVSFILSAGLPKPFATKPSSPVFLFKADSD